MKEIQLAEQFLKEQWQCIISDLVEYLKFPTVSALEDYKEQMERCATWLEEHFQKIGLTTKIVRTKGNPLVLATTRKDFSEVSKRKPHFLIYGHYDVQPPDPLDEWDHPPFEPHLTNKAIYARGASDNKGQHYIYIKAIETSTKLMGELPYDLTFFIEGEEEIGSPHLLPAIKRLVNQLRCDLIIASDTSTPVPGLPAITYALRGVASLEVVFYGSNRDLHSGIFGGCIDNPAMALCKTIAKLRDEKGRITIPGFYDNVRPISSYERALLRKLPQSKAALKKLLGVPRLFGEEGYSIWEQRSARPTIEINGLSSGYQGQGVKTIIPAKAIAKLSMRIVPDQKPDEIVKKTMKFIKNSAPKTVHVEMIPHHGAEPYYIDPQSPWIVKSIKVIEKLFTRKPCLLREGGSIPIIPQLSKTLNAPVLLLGLASPTDNAHSPNEKFDLLMLKRGIILVTCLLASFCSEG